MFLRSAVALGLFSLATPAFADDAAFSTGPVIAEFGPAAAVETDFDIPEGAAFKHSFDVSKQAEAGALNRSLVSAARFLNMHGRAGVAPENMALALVIHGGATKDVTKAGYYAETVGGENANAALINALRAQGVRIIVCGQSAAYYGVANDDLLPGVEMALSAMTAHALLQQQGYTVNPF